MTFSCGTDAPQADVVASPNISQARRDCLYFPHLPAHHYRSPRKTHRSETLVYHTSGTGSPPVFAVASGLVLLWGSSPPRFGMAVLLLEVWVTRLSDGLTSTVRSESFSLALLSDGW